MGLIPIPFMQTITIDLKKMPEVADFLVDKQPGDEVYLCGSIKSIDDQTAIITITDVEDRPDEEKKDMADDEKKADDTRSPQGDATSQAGASPDALRDIGGGEQAGV